MTNIVLIGVPGSGKTRFGRAYTKENNLKFIDNIPQKFSKKTGLEIGIVHDYSVNFMLAGRRLEDEYANQGTPFVSTTSLLDSIVYMGVWLRFNPRPGLLDNGALAGYAGWAIAALARDCWNYSRGFYFPYSGSDELLHEMDIAYETLLDDLGMPYEVVDRRGNITTEPISTIRQQSLSNVSKRRRI